jgi:glycosyltransferase involved in cell wall biosynthesis
MSLGKPCILTAVPGNLNIIDDYLQGVYIHNEEDMVKAMEFFITQPFRRKLMGKAAATLVKEHFSLKGEIMAYHKIYSTLARSGG